VQKFYEVQREKARAKDAAEPEVSADIIAAAPDL
jgi:hypothetical protein